VHRKDRVGVAEGELGDSVENISETSSNWDSSSITSRSESVTPRLDFQTSSNVFTVF